MAARPLVSSTSRAYCFSKLQSSRRDREKEQTSQLSEHNRDRKQIRFSGNARFFCGVAAPSPRVSVHPSCSAIVPNVAQFLYLT
jgi:hypothetical protein